MRVLARLAWVTVLLGLANAPALAAETPPAESSTDPSASIRMRNEAIVARAPDVAGVFTVLQDGAIRHLQSGLLCPASYPNMMFGSAMVFPSQLGAGMDVGCDYIRPDNGNGFRAKLSIFATRMPDGTSLDVAFDGYRREVAQTWENLTPVGPALKTGGQGSLPEFRSEEYLIQFKGRELTSQLIVAIINGWTIEIRSTFPGKPNVIEVSKESGEQTATVGIGDRLMATNAFLDAVNTVTK